MALDSMEDQTSHTMILAALEFVVLRVVETMILRIAYIQALHALRRMTLGMADMVSHRTEVMEPSVTRALVSVTSAADTFLAIVTDAAQVAEVAEMEGVAQAEDAIRCSNFFRYGCGIPHMFLKPTHSSWMLLRCGVLLSAPSQWFVRLLGSRALTGLIRHSSTHRCRSSET
jgi:hypothetical protein